MQVCVTGGTGFLGAPLVRDLLAKGAAVRVLARPSPRSERLAKSGVEIVHGDLNDAASIAAAVRNCDVVYHLAAKLDTGSLQQYTEANIGGTGRILTACAENGVGQFVYASSLAVYGPVTEGERIDEYTPFDDKAERRDPYTQSKIAADRMVSSFSRKQGLPAVIIRPGLVYGPGRPLPLGIFAFRVGSTNVVFGAARNRIPLNYVDNLVDAMQIAANTGDGLREFNVVDDDDVTLAAYHKIKSAADHTTTLYWVGWQLYVASPFAEALRSLIPMGDVRLSPHQLRRSLQDRWYDTRRIRRETGWTPRVPLAEAVERTLNAGRD